MIEKFFTQYMPGYLNNQYIIALTVLIIFFSLSKLFVYFVEKVILSLTAKTKTKFDDVLVERLNSPISWLLIFIGIRIAIHFLTIPIDFVEYIENTATSLIYIAIGAAVITVILTIVDFWGNHFAKKTKSTIDDALIPLFRKTTKAALALLVGITILDLWGINVMGLLAGLGIAGLAIGFAVKDSLGNIFGGVSLILDKTFNVGDKITLDDGTVGIVKDVGLRATRIRTFDNEMMIIPNGTLSTMTIKNSNQPDLCTRVVVPFGIEYGADPEKAKSIAVSEMKKINDVLADPEPFARFIEMADSSLNITAYFWVDEVSKVVGKKEEATYAIYKALNKHKIGIPFPTSTVYVKK